MSKFPYLWLSRIYSVCHSCYKIYFCLDSKSESSEEEESEAETENPSKSTTSADNTTNQDTSDTNPANDNSEKSKTVEQETKTYEEKKGLTLVFYQWLFIYGLALIFVPSFKIL